MWICLLATSLLALGAAPTAQPASRPADLPADIEAATVMLHPLIIREAAVQSDLGLRPEQQVAISELTGKIDGPLWRGRDQPARRRLTEFGPLIEEMSLGLERILDASQRERFEQILLQYRGATWLSRPEMGAKLGLSDDQQGRIRAIIQKTRPAYRGLDERARRGQDRAELEQYATRLRAAEKSNILAVLTPGQKERWQALLGRRFDFSRVHPPAAKAPELRDAPEWINSQPLKPADLHGHVVLVHFWTFGCSNCIRNYPAYRLWHKTYGPKGLVIIGIHTPETAGEHVVESVRSKARESGLGFPIVIDNQRKNWDAWGNNVWPAAYLVDKRGFVRYWWYGELNWQGATGQQFMARCIEELLAEAPESATRTGD